VAALLGIPDQSVDTVWLAKLSRALAASEDQMSFSHGLATGADSVTTRERNLAAGLPALALRELLRAAWYAADAGHLACEFAVSLARLRDQGIGDSDMKWLRCKGFVQHVPAAPACEVALPEADTAFFLTPRGVELCLQILEPEAPSVTGPTEPQRCSTQVLHPMLIPNWDGRERVLRLGGWVVKKFQVPARNQELVLAAFQEECWPLRIDDPLPPVGEIEPKRRLHSTIQCLNRNQRTQLLHFCGDGTGRGIRWEMLSLDLEPNESA
jgi:hypothetical protein